MSKVHLSAIGSPEFLNITTVSPLISKCEIKVLYTGGNRNKSYITKEVAADMAKTLPGCPIVGRFCEEKGDFLDHQNFPTIEDGEFVEKSLTRPYGFVAPNAKIWFQKFMETDVFGNSTEREYLLTEGYLWTGQFEEARRIVENGNGQSMEIDKESFKGFWANEANSGVDFFIVNDATFSKLCILGEDVEPCFEGGSITAPGASSHFSKNNDDFNRTLFSMMKELKETLEEKGGELMHNLENSTVDDVEKDFSESLDTKGQANTDENQSITGEFTKEEEDKKKEEEEKASEKDESAEGEKKSTESEDKDEDKKKKDFVKEEDEEEKKKDEEEDKKEKDFAKKDDEEDEEKKESSEEKKPADEQPKKDDEEDEDKKKKDFALLEQAHETLKAEFSALQEQCKALTEFKATVEGKEKDALINQFYMLSDEDKKEVIDNKVNYSLDEIEAKLSVLCVRKKVNFNLEDEASKEDSVSTTFNLNSLQEESSVPAWVKAVEATKNRIKY